MLEFGLEVLAQNKLNTQRHLRRYPRAVRRYAKKIITQMVHVAEAIGLAKDIDRAKGIDGLKRRRQLAADMDAQHAAAPAAATAPAPSSGPADVQKLQAELAALAEKLAAVQQLGALAASMSSFDSGDETAPGAADAAAAPPAAPPVPAASASIPPPPPVPVGVVPAAPPVPACTVPAAPPVAPPAVSPTGSASSSSSRHSFIPEAAPLLEVPRRAGALDDIEEAADEDRSGGSAELASLFGAMAEMQGEGPAAPEPTVARSVVPGKRVYSRNLPGIESMSFGEQIAVAKAIKLKSTGVKLDASGNLKLKKRERRSIGPRGIMNDLASAMRKRRVTMREELNESNHWDDDELADVCKPHESVDAGRKPGSGAFADIAAAAQLAAAFDGPDKEN